MKKIKDVEISSLQNWTAHLLEKLGLGDNLTDVLAVIVNIVVLFCLCWFVYWLLLQIIHLIFRPWSDKSKNPNSDIFIKKKVFHSFSHLASGLFLYSLLPYFFNLSQGAVHTIRVLIVIYVIVMLLRTLTRFFRSLEYLGQHSKRFQKKPISSYVQVALIFTYLLCGIIIISILIGKSPMTIITAFGAGMAIVLLVFKDLILGLVASIQVSVNDMVRVGDWIAVYSYEADGVVTEINLTSVKVRNWDETLTNVPTYALVSKGFKNVREMQDKGIRRLMHHLLIDVRTVKAVDHTFFESLRDKGFFEKADLQLTWQDTDAYKYDQVKTLTNLGLFRLYIEMFLRRHPGINNEYMVVRQLQHEGQGLPIEIYAFVNNVSFKPLNLIQSDIFEHLYAIIDDFELDLYQRPIGHDFGDLNPRSNATDPSSPNKPHDTDQ